MKVLIPLFWGRVRFYNSFIPPLYSTAFWRFTAIMGDRGHIVNTTYLKSGVDEST
jgi:hypothetical protein